MRCRPGFASSYINQFMTMFSAVNYSLIVSKYIAVDYRMGDLNAHLNAIFTHLRNNAISADRSKDSSLLCNSLLALHVLLSTDEGCAAFSDTQVLLKEAENPVKLRIAIQTDYLAPFFDLHPTEFIGRTRLVQPDISTPQAVDSMHNQFTVLVDDVKMLNVRFLCLVDSRTGKRQC